MCSTVTEETTFAGLQTLGGPVHKLVRAQNQRRVRDQDALCEANTTDQPDSCSFICSMWSDFSFSAGSFEGV